MFLKKWRFILVSIVSQLILCTTVLAQEKTVVYPGFERNSYFITLLQHALSYKSDASYKLKPFGNDIPKKRAFDLMNARDGIDVMMGSATNERLELYRAVHFPLLKGLNGYRVSLIHKSTPDIFKYVKNPENLTAFTATQFHTWTDTTIFKFNSIPIAPGSDYEGMYRMLHKRRVDYFPRSILELQGDLSNHTQLDLAVDPYILIQYPSAYYYYVAKSNSQLADDIKLGLEKALVDGSFEQLFNRFYEKVLIDLNVEQRKIIKLKNPLIPSAVPIERSELWYIARHQPRARAGT